jgi:hypothetical protein
VFSAKGLVDRETAARTAKTLSDPPPMGCLDLVIRKQQVLGSNPSVGSSDLNVKPGHWAGFLTVLDTV